jgi:Transposase domain (DUF772)/Transposase DDE domain
MYKENKSHLQPLLISNVSDLPEKYQQRLERSWAGVFYRETFCRLKEEGFAILYDDQPSRPNIPVNVLVGLETLKAGFGWSDEELYDHYVFDIQVRYALGYRDLKDGEFDVRTLYNFRQRLSRYNQEHGVNLLNKAFEEITDQQISALRVQTRIQRMDSTQIASNIMDMSRLQLLVEAFQRLYRILSEADRQSCKEMFAPYLKVSSGHYTYAIKGKEETHRNIQEVGENMYRVVSELKDRYKAEPVFQVFERFFNDNFHLEAQQVQAKKNEEISAECLQSCDDLEATFRRKKEQEYKGYVANLAETCEPNNPCQLITKVQVAPNHVEDSDLMIAAVPDLKQRTDLEILHTDGAYSSPEADPVLQENQVELVPTAIKGRHPDQDKFGLAAYTFQVDEQGMPIQMTCPQKQVACIHWGNKKGALVADFEPLVCETCPFHKNRQCRAKPGKRDKRYHLDFNLHEVQVARRRRAKDQQKHRGKNLRAAVEATMRTIKHPFPAGKLPVRGLFRVTSLIVGSALMGNVRSILRYEKAKFKQDQSQIAPKEHETGSSEQPFLSFLRLHWLQMKAFLRLFDRPLSCFSC